MNHDSFVISLCVSMVLCLHLFSEVSMTLSSALNQQPIIVIEVIRTTIILVLIIVVRGMIIIGILVVIVQILAIVIAVYS